MDTPLIDDDHIIALLRKDAQSNRPGSFRTERRDRNAPKPNTRFLRNLVRDTDSHNAALLAKEKAETRARLKGLERDVERGRGTDEGSSRGEQGRKRKSRGGEREGRWKGVMAGLGQPSLRERDGETREERHDRKHRDHRTGPSAKEAHDCSTRDDSHARKRRRTQSPDSRPRQRSRSRSPAHHKRRSDRERRDHRRHRSRTRSRDKRPRSSHRPHDQIRTTKSTKPTHRQESPPPSSDSDDPLAAFLGPAPPSSIRPRGRGATNGSTIDLRFNDPSYDPRADVARSESEEDRERDGQGDDWALSLEAQRDRAAWRANGARRLREVGFGERDVGQWETGTGIRGREKDERDLRWRARGEGREWDAGKVEGDSGEVKVKAAWTKGLGL